jgi:hypothetical protein
VLLVLLTSSSWCRPRRSGPLALTEVFAPWLFLPLLVLLPFAWALRDRALVIALGWRRATFAVHLGPALVPAARPQPPAGAAPVRVASWNIYIRNPAARWSPPSGRWTRTWSGWSRSTRGRRRGECATRPCMLATAPC